MSTNSTDYAASPAGAGAPPAKAQSGSARLIILLVLLVAAIAALIYDFAVAGPSSIAAEKRLTEFVDTKNKLGVKEGGTVTQADVQKELGMKPTWVDKHDDKHYEIEYYCWRGPIPVVNMMKHYLAVVYIGDGPVRRISSHYLNDKPPREALPMPDEGPPEGGHQAISDPESPPAEGATPAETPAGEPAAKSSETPPSEK
jgi:hypothetical protein